MKFQLVLLVTLFAVTWANETSELRHRPGGGRPGGGNERPGGGNGVGHHGGGHGHHVCRDYYGCCRYANYPYYFRQCCYYNGCCPSCSTQTAAPVTPAPTTPAITAAPTTPDAAQCVDQFGCCALIGRPLLYIACIRSNGCAPSCGSLGFIIKPSCTQARECCDYEFLSSDFNKCCSFYGCCPTCKRPISDRKCRPKPVCSDEGGACKKKCSADEDVLKVRKPCKGRRCKCCVPKEVVITPDCVNATECCSFEAGTGEFYECCAKYDCCPTCAVSGCPFGNETYSDGEVVRSYPEKCFDLVCSLTTLSEAPYFISQITEYQHSNSCSCCTLAGKMYADGYLLTDDDYCIAVQCMGGEWVNQGYINSNCRGCQIQSPLLAFRTFDGSSYTYGEESCRYSMVQTPKDPSTSYVHVDFDKQGTLNQGFYNEYLYFQDTGAAEVSCPASDPINNCDYGAVTATPQEITSVGTLAFSWTLGIDFSVIMGVNKITTMYTDDSLLIWAPVSMYDELEGLCGEFNGDSSDDLLMSTGQTTTDSTIFAESWHSTQSGSNCSLLGSNAGTRHVEMLPAIKEKGARNHQHEKNNSMAVGNCASFESDEDLEEYHAACKAAMAKNTSDTLNRWGLEQRSEDSKDEHMDMCMQISCLCPDDQAMCLDTFMSMNKLVVEMEMRTLDPAQLHNVLDQGNCKKPITGTFKPETTPEMTFTTDDDGQKTIGFGR